MYNTYLTGVDFNVGIYIRLSQEDKDKKYESDSESVINQKELLRGYVKNNNFNLVKEYVDDGYSGTDFERPGFQKMLEDINNKKINCVIVKDLSRLGRNHVMTGYYIETFFPENDVRFISVMESYDSAKSKPVMIHQHLLLHVMTIIVNKIHIKLGMYYILKKLQVNLLEVNHLTDI